uniref:Uncharacterized protein n=1 Tax=Cacopsylla melanoneura TaxID=428564 RepID=A0A8D8SUH2_9HEMI
MRNKLEELSSFELRNKLEFEEIHPLNMRNKLEFEEIHPLNMRNKHFDYFNSISTIIHSNLIQLKARKKKKVTENASFQQVYTRISSISSSLITVSGSTNLAVTSITSNFSSPPNRKSTNCSADSSLYFTSPQSVRTSTSVSLVIQVSAGDLERFRSNLATLMLELLLLVDPELLTLDSSLLIPDPELLLLVLSKLKRILVPA